MQKVRNGNSHPGLSLFLLIGLFFNRFNIWHYTSEGRTTLGAGGYITTHYTCYGCYCAGLVKIMTQGADGTIKVVYLMIFLIYLGVPFTDHLLAFIGQLSPAIVEFAGVLEHQTSLLLSNGEDAEETSCRDEDGYECNYDLSPVHLLSFRCSPPEQGAKATDLYLFYISKKFICLLYCPLSPIIKIVVIDT